MYIFIDICRWWLAAYPFILTPARSLHLLTLTLPSRANFLACIGFSSLLFPFATIPSDSGSAGFSSTLGSLTGLLT